MDRRIHKVNDADKLFYYFFSENESCNLVLRLDLKCRIDRAVLKKALNRTLDRFPNFRQTPVLDAHGQLFTTDNEAEAEVYPYDPYSVNLGTADTNGYLFRLMYEGSSLWISVFHGVCDGRGYMMFARTLMYYYLTYAGHNISDSDGLILTDRTPRDSSEMADPFDTALEGEPAANPFKPSGSENIYYLPDRNKGTDECRHYSLSRYVLNSSRLVALAKEAGTTVDTYFHLLMAKLFRNDYDVGDRTIAGMGAVDLRPFYKSRYLQNLRELFWIYYPPDFFKLSDRDAADLIDKKFKGPQLSRHNFDGVLLACKDALNEMLGFPIKNEAGLRIMREHVWEAPELLVTYFTTNLGRFDFGKEINAFILHADMYGPAIFQCPGIFLLTLGNETSVTLTQRHFNRSLALKMKEVFIKEGLLLDDELGAWFENDKIRVGKLPSL